MQIASIASRGCIRCLRLKSHHHTHMLHKQDAVLGDYLRITYSLRSDTQWAPEGTVFGWEQFEVAAPHAAPKAASAPAMEALTVAEEGDLIRVQNKVFSAVVDRSTGQLVSYIDQATATEV